MYPGGTRLTCHPNCLSVVPNPSSKYPNVLLNPNPKSQYQILIPNPYPTSNPIVKSQSTIPISNLNPQSQIPNHHPQLSIYKFQSPNLNSLSKTLMTIIKMTNLI